jgi:hypothetical protein
MIMSRAGDTLVVSGSGGKTTVLLSANTRVKDDKGLFGLDKQEMADTVLIPGLKVRVDGSSDSLGQFRAQTITVDGDDLEASEMIQAGLHPTAEQVAANVVGIENNKKVSRPINRISQRISRTSRPTRRRLLPMLSRLKRTLKTSRRIQIASTGWTTTV